MDSTVVTKKRKRATKTPKNQDLEDSEPKKKQRKPKQKGNNNVLVVRASDEMIPSKEMTERSTDSSRLVITGVDPGPVNTGLVMFDALNNKIIDVDLMHLCEPGTTNTIPRVELLSRLREQILDPQAKFHRYFSPQYTDVVYVEDQSHTSIDRQISLQMLILSLLQKRGQIAHPKMVIRTFPTVFVAPANYETMTEMAIHKCDKKNSCIGGKRLLNENGNSRLKAKLKTIAPDKQDNIYDALWIAKYGAEREKEKRKMEEEKEQN